MTKPISQREARALRKSGTEVDAIYEAVIAYVKSKGGNIAVIGGIQIQQWPSQPSRNFTVAIKCTGRMPKFAKPTE